jgi:hypothetical protein
MSNHAVKFCHGQLKRIVGIIMAFIFDCANGIKYILLLALDLLEKVS